MVENEQIRTGVEGARQFLISLQRNRQLQTRVKEAAQQITEIAGEKGYTFTVDDLNEALKEVIGGRATRQALGAKKGPSPFFFFSEPAAF